MARHFLKSTLAAGVLLAVGLALFGCKTTGTGAAQAPAAAPTGAPAPATQADPMADLERRMFLLPDGRDMSFVIVRAVGQGANESAAREAAQELTFADFRSWLNDSAQAHRVSYLGGGRIQVDALHLHMDGVEFMETNFVFHLTNFATAGKTIEGVILDRLVLDGRDLTRNAGLKAYELLLQRKIGL
jgi:hypothetical protein